MIHVHQPLQICCANSKILGSATSYGIWAQMDRLEEDEKVEVYLPRNRRSNQRLLKAALHKIGALKVVTVDAALVSKRQ